MAHRQLEISNVAEEFNGESQPCRWRLFAFICESSSIKLGQSPATLPVCDQQFLSIVHWRVTVFLKLLSASSNTLFFSWFFCRQELHRPWTTSSALVGGEEWSFKNCSRLSEGRSDSPGFLFRSWPQGSQLQGWGSSSGSSAISNHPGSSRSPLR